MEEKWKSVDSNLSWMLRPALGSTSLEGSAHWTQISVFSFHIRSLHVHHLFSDNYPEPQDTGSVFCYKLLVHPNSGVMTSPSAEKQLTHAICATAIWSLT